MSEGKGEKAKVGTVELVERVTQTVPAYRTPDGESLTLEQYLVWLGQQILDIKKAIG